MCVDSFLHLRYRLFRQHAARAEDKQGCGEAAGREQADGRIPARSGVQQARKGGADRRGGVHRRRSPDHQERHRSGHNPGRRPQVVDISADETAGQIAHTEENHNRADLVNGKVKAFRGPFAQKSERGIAAQMDQEISQEGASRPAASEKRCVSAPEGLPRWNGIRLRLHGRQDEEGRSGKQQGQDSDCEKGERPAFCRQPAADRNPERLGYREPRIGKPHRLALFLCGQQRLDGRPHLRCGKSCADPGEQPEQAHRPEVSGHSAQRGGHRKAQQSEQHDLFPIQPVRERAGDQGEDRGAKRVGAHHPAGHSRGDAVQVLKRRNHRGDEEAREAPP
ncbi:hypothetical protein BGX30_004027 [Mortierella sp. GBA39]|nr:hypothetical protein BGX30_004027 [Mortierella sp. GBA39]